MKHWIVPILSLVVLFGGVAAKKAITHPITPSESRIILLDEPQNVGMFYWEREIKKSDPDPILVFGHGANIGGVWFVSRYDGKIAPVNWVVNKIRKEFPSQRIYLIICNPGGIDLDIPGVSYAKVNVWKFPDVNFLSGATLDDMFDMDNAGALDEFIHNPW